MVVKRDGRREVFSREKLLSGIRKACQKRQVSKQTVENLVDRICTDLADAYESEVPGSIIGERVMNELQKLDKVAYVRFASVYRQFQEATDFVQAVKNLEEEP